MMDGLYHPGRSWLHRASAGAKLGGLALFSTIVLLAPMPVGPSLAFAIALVLWRSAGLPWAMARRQILWLAPFLLLIVASQLWFADPQEAAGSVLRLLSLMLAATLISAVTSLSAMIDALCAGFAPFRRFGLRPQRLAFAIGLSIRFIPAVGIMAVELADAARARGARPSLALAPPLLIRALKFADQIAEAIEARGLDGEAAP